VSDGDVQRFAEELGPFLGTKHSFEAHNLDEALVEDYPILTKHLTRMTYARLYIPKLFPELDRAVYIDSDIIVRLPVDELADMDLDAYYVAATQDINDGKYVRSCCDRELFAELGMDMRQPCFNAGFAVMNLKAWREDAVSQKAMTFMAKYGSRILKEDQSVMNVLAHKRWKMMPREWNFMVVLNQSKARFVHRSVVNYHTVSGNKPWFFEKEGPCEIIRLFYSYLDRTHWQEYHKREAIWRCRWSAHNILMRRIRYRITDLFLDAHHALTGRRHFRRA
jgi:lipopolysaccharide biosynthesis glycosyltransferase